jgi:hypothetical protein
MIPNILASLEAYVMTNGYTDKAAMIELGMITATQHLEASPKPSYGPHKAEMRYLDDADDEVVAEFLAMLEVPPPPTIADVLQALETLRTHLRKKYYAG